MLHRLIKRIVKKNKNHIANNLIYISLFEF